MLRQSCREATYILDPEPVRHIDLPNLGLGPQDLNFPLRDCVMRNGVLAMEYLYLFHHIWKLGASGVSVFVPSYLGVGPGSLHKLEDPVSECLGWSV